MLRVRWVCYNEGAATVRTRAPAEKEGSGPMRRGSRLLLLLGLLIAAGAAAFLFFFLQGRVGQPQQPEALVPTEIPEVDVVVARIDIPRGVVISDTETLLKLEPISGAEYERDAASYLTDVGAARDRLSLTEINLNEPVRASQLGEPGLAQQIPTAEPDQPRPKALPFSVGNLTGVGDLIQPGDRVDIVSSFIFNRQVIAAGVGIDPTTQQPIIIPQISASEGRSTKTIVQNVEVLRVLKPAAPPPAEGEPTPPPEEGAPPEDAAQQGDSGGEVPADGQAVPGETFQRGTWILVLAVTDQEAELIKFAQEQVQSRVVLVLRGSDDNASEQTTGVTLDLMISRYGLPVPDPFLSRELEGVTPVPTIAPAPAP